MKLAADRKALINELCQYCGKYKKAHEGSCDGCKWGGNVMDAVKFVKEYLRMCGKVSDCEECPAFMTDFCTVNVEEQSQETAGEVVRVVEEWSAAHPRKTRQSVFLEQYPEARIGDDGVLKVCPLLISASYRNNDGNCATMQRQCSDCRKDFWGQEVE